MDIGASVEKLLETKIGLKPGIIVGRENLGRIVETAMTQAGVTDGRAYLRLLSSCGTEFLEIMEKLVVHETWFFRDHEPFRFMERLASEMLAGRPDRKIRILSAPCSTGEEPYSIAISLLATGVRPEQFHIDAADISRAGLAAAGRAVYGRGSFRQPLTSAQAGFFTAFAKTRKLDGRVMRCVHFHRANLVDPLFLAGCPPYDMVFCRNVLIYLTEEARDRVFVNIDRLLASDGVFFAGHAEMGLLRKHGYNAAGHARSFACVRGEKALPHGNVKSAPRLRTSAIPKDVFVDEAVSGAVSPLPPPPAASAEADALQSRARALADEGLFGEAADLCGRYLKEQMPHADVYCLMGIIREAERRFRDAEECYEKALYLEPGHYETLVHLSLLCRQRGESGRADRYRQRAQASEGRINAAVGP
jgi:chemotaxis protein methyltransferase WspC